MGGEKSGLARRHPGAEFDHVCQVEERFRDLGMHVQLGANLRDERFLMTVNWSVGGYVVCNYVNSAIRMMIGMGMPRNSSKSERMVEPLEVDWFMAVSQASRCRPP